MLTENQLNMADFNEPNIADYYNEQPHMVNVIDKMNDEFSEVQKENDMLKERIKELESQVSKFTPKQIKLEGIDVNNFMDIEEQLDSALQDAFQPAIKYDECDEGALKISDILKMEDYVVELLMSHSKQSEEWCKHRVRQSFSKLLVLKMVDDYWWDELIKSEELSKKIIDCVIQNIISGEYDYEGEIFKNVLDPCIQIGDAFIYKCQTCKKYCNSDLLYYDEDNKKLECYECEAGNIVYHDDDGLDDIFD